MITLLLKQVAPPVLSCDIGPTKALPASSVHPPEMEMSFLHFHHTINHYLFMIIEKNSFICSKRWRHTAMQRLLKLLVLSLI